MGIDLADQVRTFLGAAALGGCLGLVYDVFRVLRRRLRLPLVGALLDLGFWLLVTVGLFCYATAAGGGEVRIYMAAALFLGALLYFLLLSPPALLLVGLAADGAALLLRLLLLPVDRLHRLGKKIQKSLKKHFHYRREWYKLNLIPGEMDDLTRPRDGRWEGRDHAKDQESRTAHQAGDSGLAHLSWSGVCFYRLYKDAHCAPV